MTRTKILDIHGKEKGSIDLPKEFSAVVRNDIISKVVEAKRQNSLMLRRLLEETAFSVGKNTSS